MKATILGAYEAGRMTAVLPFVRLLLEPCMDSKVFKPPNPWVMGILALLVRALGAGRGGGRQRGLRCWAGPAGC